MADCHPDPYLFEHPFLLMVIFRYHTNPLCNTTYTSLSLTKCVAVYQGFLIISPICMNGIHTHTHTHTTGVCIFKRNSFTCYCTPPLYRSRMPDYFAGKDSGNEKKHTVGTSFWQMLHTLCSVSTFFFIFH